MKLPENRIDLREHVLQISFLQFLQALQIYETIGFRSIEEWKQARIDFPRDRMEKLIQMIALSETILVKLPAQSAKRTAIEHQVQTIEENLHQLVIYLRRLPFTTEWVDRYRLMTKIDKLVEQTRIGYWEAIDWFELQSDHFLFAHKPRRNPVSKVYPE